MSPAALWQVMKMFKIPDVDLMEQIYECATVKPAPKHDANATISSMPRYACSR